MKTLAELSINTYVTEQIQDTSVYTSRYTFAEKEKLSFIVSVGKDKCTDFCIYFRRDLQKDAEQIHKSFLMSIFEFRFRIYSFPPLSSRRSSSCKPLFTHPPEVFKRKSLTLESAGRDWIPFHILSPSLPCQPL